MDDLAFTLAESRALLQATQYPPDMLSSGTIVPWVGRWA